MSEMLGNQYFISQRYELARIIFQKNLLVFPDNPCVKKKLIICDIELGLIDEAFNLFHRLVTENPECFINKDDQIDDSPCYELIFEYETNKTELSDLTKDLTLGMLWLFINIDESIKYIKKVEKNNYKTIKIEEILTKLTVIKKKTEAEDGKE